MFSVEQIEGWKGQAVVDADGERVGKLAEVYIDGRTGQPTLAAVKLGRRKDAVLAPLVGASVTRSHVRLPYPADLLRTAPRLGGDELIHRADEVVIGQHFGVVVPADDGSDGAQYQSSAAIEAHRAALAQATAEADELERQAHEKLANVVDRQTIAAQATAEADHDEAQRRDLLAEAELIRRRAGN